MKKHRFEIQVIENKIEVTGWLSVFAVQYTSQIGIFVDMVCKA